MLLMLAQIIFVNVNSIKIPRTKVVKGDEFCSGNKNVCVTKRDELGRPISWYEYHSRKQGNFTNIITLEKIQFPY